MTQLQFIQKIAEIALAEKAKGNDLFFSYSSHVQLITTTYHKGGWKSEKRTSFDIYIDSDNYEEWKANDYLSKMLIERKVP